MASTRHMEEGAASADLVRIVSRRMVRPSPPPPSEAVEIIHLSPWDLRLLTVDYIQKGIILPMPPVSGERLVDTLASSFARALGRYYQLAGRLFVEEHANGTVTVPLRCSGEGAEFIHASVPSTSITVADIIGSTYTPSLVRAFYQQNELLNAEAAIESIPVLAVQVTELADGVFIGVSMNHSVGDGTAFWELLNTWSEINRRGFSDDLREIFTPSPALRRWFVDSSPVPIPLPFRKLQHIVRRFEYPTVQEGFFTFSAASIKKLKARANDEAAGMATAPISCLQALLAHLWRAVCRARRLQPGQETFYTVIIGCRGRVKGIPPGYVGNAVTFGKATSTVGEILDKGLGWTAWQLNRAVASFDEATITEWLDRWVREPEFTYVGNLSAGNSALLTGSSPRFDVFGNDFGWGKPVAVRSGAGNKMDGKATVFEGPERGGSVSLEVCLAADALERLAADEEFMDAVSVPT